MPSPNLRVTSRCLEDDLGCDKDLVKKDARDFEDVHPAVKKFVSMRGASPSTGEPSYGPYPRGQIRALHVGAARGVTAWDESEDVCWLLAYNDFHRNGDPNDAFVVFNSLYSAAQLLPTDDDYEHFFADEQEAFLDRMLDASRQLLESARENPGREEVRTWGNGRQIMCVDVVVEGDSSAEEGWMGLTLPEDEAAPDTEIYELVGELLLPGVVPIYSDKFRDRVRRSGEIVYHWTHYEGTD